MLNPNDSLKKIKRSPIGKDSAIQPEDTGICVTGINYFISFDVW